MEQTTVNWNIWLLVIVFALGALSCFLVLWWKKKHDPEKVLSSIFGKPTFATTLTLTEVKEWIKARKELLGNGVEALVTQANSKTLQSLTADSKLHFKKKIKFLVIAIVNQSSDENVIVDCVLIKYQKLDGKLEAVLARGDGVLVVEN